MASTETLEASVGTGRRGAIRIALAALALTAFFMLLRFPYDRVADRLIDRVERDAGVRISRGPVGLSLVRLAPGIAARDVQVVTRAGTRIDFERVGARPALALSWLRRRPALGVELESAQGAASGVATLGDRPGFSGRLEQLDLALLPQAALAAGMRVEGRADAAVDLAFTESGPEGSVVFDAQKGSVYHPQLPIPLAYEKLAGDVALGGDTTAEIREMTLESPLASGRMAGNIGRAPRFEASPLQLEIGLTVSGPVRGSLNAQGVNVGNRGEVLFKVSGTVGRPIVQ